MNKYLDTNGLLYLWTKIKAYVTQQTSGPAAAVEWEHVLNKPELALKSDIASMYKYKGSKARLTALPATGNAVGDVWNVEEGGMNYAWDGKQWDALGEIFEIKTISNAEIDSITAAAGE